VDDADYPFLSQFKWHLSYSGYPTRTLWLGRQYRPTHRELPMHHHLCRVTPQQPYADHRSGNKLDNRRANLRPTNKSQNGSNRGMARHNTTGFKGVSKHGRRFIAQIRCNNKNRYLGRFSNPEDAARAYDKAAKVAFGEYAVLNGL
jgi:hypothetical protein